MIRRFGTIFIMRSLEVGELVKFSHQGAVTLSSALPFGTTTHWGVDCRISQSML